MEAGGCDRQTLLDSGARRVWFVGSHRCERVVLEAPELFPSTLHTANPVNAYSSENTGTRNASHM